MVPRIVNRIAQKFAANQVANDTIIGIITFRMATQPSPIPCNIFKKKSPIATINCNASLTTGSAISGAKIRNRTDDIIKNTNNAIALNIIVLLFIINPHNVDFTY